MANALGPVAETTTRRAEALELLRSLMSRMFGVPAASITAKTVATDIERWDSLAMVTLSLGLERRLNRSLPIEDFVAAKSVAALLDIICGAPPSVSTRANV